MQSRTKGIINRNWYVVFLFHKFCISKVTVSFSYSECFRDFIIVCVSLNPFPGPAGDGDAPPLFRRVPVARSQLRGCGRGPMLSAAAPPSERSGAVLRRWGPSCAGPPAPQPRACPWRGGNRGAGAAGSPCRPRAAGALPAVTGAGGRVRLTGVLESCWRWSFPCSVWFFFMTTDWGSNVRKRKGCLYICQIEDRAKIIVEWWPPTEACWLVRPE